MSNSYKAVWETLSKVDCSKHIEKKGNLSYLSWAWAWGTLMEYYPQATYKVHKERHLNDGTVECRVTITIGECSRMMWLPAMDNRNNAVANPNARQISDTRMRCLVKCCAMFGLGHYVYAGEDLPQQDAPKAAPKRAPAKPVPSKPITPQQVKKISGLITETETDMSKFLGWLGVQSIGQIQQDNFQRAVDALNAKKVAA